MPPRIFISYRRDDAAGEAGRLADHMNRRFGRGQVFLDIDTIDPGRDFVKVLQASLGVFRNSFLVLRGFPNLIVDDVFPSISEISH